eukprot:TRINITY_DN9962_c0_g1_i4.p1 TRINITY_DN9962_c0_g1~~TRINITY_DN9962_c0_g1_i4.p1  ORF type:complete len:356 (+),score=42.30 TRINITY_DN9962_c0_g1_i4:457-1524(+)
MSAISHLAGLYPFQTGPVLAESEVKLALPPFNITVDIVKLGSDALPERYQPLPIHTVSSHDDAAFSSTHFDICPNLAAYAKEMPTLPDYKNMTDVFTPNFEKIATIYGLDPGKITMLNAKQVFDSLITDYFANNETKIEYNTQLFKNITYIHDSISSFEDFRTWDQIRLTMTPFLREIISRIEARFNGSTPNAVWYTYSAHDTNLHNYLIAFNLTGWRCEFERIFINNQKTCFSVPEFASLMLFEIYEDETEDEVFIKLKYNDQEFSLCGGPTMCPFSDVREIFEQYYIYPDWEQRCGLIPPPDNNPRNWEILVHVGLIFLGILFVILTITLTILLRIKQKHRRPRSLDSSVISA